MALNARFARKSCSVNQRHKKKSSAVKNTAIFQTERGRWPLWPAHRTQKVAHRCADLGARRLPCPGHHGHADTTRSNASSILACPCHNNQHETNTKLIPLKVFRLTLLLLQFVSNHAFEHGSGLVRPELIQQKVHIQHDGLDVLRLDNLRRINTRNYGRVLGADCGLFGQ
jgi:hypothetical protein